MDGGVHVEDVSSAVRENKLGSEIGGVKPGSSRERLVMLPAQAKQPQVHAGGGHHYERFAGSPDGAEPCRLAGVAAVDVVELLK